MPVEIKELIIKATVSPTNEEHALGKEKICAADIDRLKREIKRECMDELKQFIKDQNER
jgi:hypothetical protein